MTVTRIQPGGASVVRIQPFPPAGGTPAPPTHAATPVELAVLWNAVEDPDPTTWVTDSRVVLPRATPVIDGSTTTNLDMTFVAL